MFTLLSMGTVRSIQSAAWALHREADRGYGPTYRITDLPGLRDAASIGDYRFLFSSLSATAVSARHRLG
ncbi:protein of unknown function [Methylocaldum szegediense]|uniref:Uncharacterized protein n=1 Tax=Methylocaldum szegediense TaxID=73780 RepID=A0ABM9HZY8_9GAMM|nr:protein of unknown function [Methylocaldum szegediense]